MAALTAVRTLEVDAAGAAHLAAASGVACAGRWLYVVADDELELGVFSRDDPGPGRLAPFLTGEPLPEPHAERKAAKPDLEALCVLPGGRLLALGSGSTATRRRGAVHALGPGGALAGAPQPLDLAPLYDALGERFEALNVEGAAPLGDRLVLAQRGDALGRGNALVELDLHATLAAVEHGVLDAGLVREVHPVSLGTLDGVGLTLSDVAPAPAGDHLLFTAVAEDAPDAYQDGPFAGAAVGGLDAGGAVRWWEPVEPSLKVEGIEAVGPGHVLLVTDDDDRATPGRLLAAALP